MARLPYKKNKLTQVEFAEALREGYKLAFGRDPTAEELAGGWAQGILEMGRGVYLPQNNVGNIKATKSWVQSGNPYFVMSTGEYTSTGEYFEHTGAKWRAYNTPAEGAAGYWKLIGGRYKVALDWMAAGDPTSASVALGMNGYYTASISMYSGRVNSIYGEFMEKIAPKLPGLKSEAKAPPGDKPAVKKWVADYSKAEKEAVLKPKSETSDIASDDIEDLINQLYASNKPLLNIVKQGILKKMLPTSNVLIRVAECTTNTLEYARLTSSLLNRYLDADSDICTNGKLIEISCSLLGSEQKVVNAVSAVCDLFASGMNKAVEYQVDYTVISGLISAHAIIDSNQLIANRRKFVLNRLIK